MQEQMHVRVNQPRKQSAIAQGDNLCACRMLYCLAYFGNAFPLDQNFARARYPAILNVEQAGCVQHNWMSWFGGLWWSWDHREKQNKHNSETVADDNRGIRRYHRDRLIAGQRCWGLLPHHCDFPTLPATRELYAEASLPTMTLAFLKSCLGHPQARPVNADLVLPRRDRFQEPIIKIDRIIKR